MKMTCLVLVPSAFRFVCFVCRGDRFVSVSDGRPGWVALHRPGYEYAAFPEDYHRDCSRSGWGLRREYKSKTARIRRRRRNGRSLSIVARRFGWSTCKRLTLGSSLNRSVCRLSIPISKGSLSVQSSRTISVSASSMCTSTSHAIYQANLIRSGFRCARLGLQSLSYLWQYDQTELLEDMDTAGMESVIIKVAGAGLGQRHLGKNVCSSEMRDELERLVSQSTRSMKTTSLTLRIRAAESEMGHTPCWRRRRVRDIHGRLSALQKAYQPVSRPLHKRSEEAVPRLTTDGQYGDGSSGPLVRQLAR